MISGWSTVLPDSLFRASTWDTLYQKNVNLAVYISVKCKHAFFKYKARIEPNLRPNLRKKLLKAAGNCLKLFYCSTR